MNQTLEGYTSDFWRNIFRPKCIDLVQSIQIYLVQGSKFIFGFGSTCATRCNFLGTEFKILGAQLQIPIAPTPIEYLTLQKERLRLLVSIWAYSSSIEHNENK